MKKHKNRNLRRRGLLLTPDDLAVGKYVAVHSVKGSNQHLAFFGLASEIKVINLPFIVVLPVGSHDTATIDVRNLILMPVTEEFVQAQTPQQAMTIENGILVNTEKAEP